MSTLANRKDIQTFYVKKWIKPYFFTALLCLIFSFIYSQFSHGVSSPHMTYLFLYPLILGDLVGISLYCFEKTSKDYFWTSHLYHTGVVALILGSLLRGVFDIAGTASIYQTALSIGGAVMLFCSIISYAICKMRQLIK